MNLLCFKMEAISAAKNNRWKLTEHSILFAVILIFLALKRVV